MKKKKDWLKKMIEKRVSKISNVESGNIALNSVSPNFFGQWLGQMEKPDKEKA